MAGDRRDHQKVSVVLGYDKIGYESSSAAMNALAGQVSLSATTEGNKNKECHVQFGEPGVYKREFTTSSKLLDPTGEVHKYRGQLSTADKDMLVRTSSVFTGEVAPFVTSTGLATQWDPAAVRETVALRDEIRRRTGPRPTRGMSYDDEIEYVSESKSAFDNKFRSHKPSIMAASVKNGGCLQPMVLYPQDELTPGYRWEQTCEPRTLRWGMRSPTTIRARTSSSSRLRTSSALRLAQRRCMTSKSRR